jgi:hypothetical protein
MVIGFVQGWESTPKCDNFHLRNTGTFDDKPLDKKEQFPYLRGQTQIIWSRQWVVSTNGGSFQQSQLCSNWGYFLL